ncbi:hypothetical protein [Stygiolobus sp. CP859M]|uniref:hypothetical protein n=1 Tax=Stygiolobus sp. CP859M TaxID=3133135 RepID=UPI00307E80F9
MIRLRLYEGLIELYGTFRRIIASRAYVTCLGLAIEAIENGYELWEVRRRLLEIELEAKAKYGKVSRDYGH